MNSAGDPELPFHEPADDIVNMSIPRAAFIDALQSASPSNEFSDSLRETLLAAGFEVDVFHDTAITVEFLKNFGANYNLTILRMHSALSSNNELYLFTAEPYCRDKYQPEQQFGLVKEAYTTNASDSVFAVNWGFIKRCMTGRFNGTLVILMGCEGSCDPQIFREFINQGAIGCVGWSGPVLLSHSDRAVLHLLECLYLKNLRLEDALSDTNKEIGKDPCWGTILERYAPK